MFLYLSRLSPQSLLGSFPSWMLTRGNYVQQYFTAARDGAIFEQSDDAPVVTILTPRKTNLRMRLGGCDDELFLEFLAALLSLDPHTRPTAAQALQHPWLQPENELSFDPYVLPR